MKKGIQFILVGGVVLAAAGAFLLRGQLDGLYHNFGKNLENFQHTDLGTVISEVGKEILAPSPLRIGGKENEVVLNSISVVAETNLQRQENGQLPALSQNTKLNQAAMAKARDMFEGQYFEHVSPSGVDPGNLVKSFGYSYIITGENLILGNFASEAEMVQLWMNSPGHRANILNKRFTEIGVAVLKGSYHGDVAWIGVQEFGLPFDSCPQADESIKKQIEINKATLNELTVLLDTKRAEIERTNRHSERYNQLVDEYNAMVAEYNRLNEATKILIADYNRQINNFNQCVSGS